MASSIEVLNKSSAIGNPPARLEDLEHTEGVLQSLEFAEDGEVLVRLLGTCTHCGGMTLRELLLPEEQAPRLQPFEGQKVRILRIDDSYRVVA